VDTMDMSILTVIGTVASIIGAWVSVKYASKATDAAKEAKRIRAQLIDQRKTSELSKIQASCKKALDSMVKYGPASTPTSLAGISTKKDSFDVQEFILLIKEHRTHFDNKTLNEADKFCNVLIPLLESFANSSTIENQQKFGKQIVMNLSSISATIKKRLDSRCETVH
jgi:hypothetical protein